MIVAYYTVVARCVCRLDTVMPDITEHIVPAFVRHGRFQCSVKVMRLGSGCWEKD